MLPEASEEGIKLGEFQEDFRPGNGGGGGAARFILLIRKENR